MGRSALDQRSVRSVRFGAFEVDRDADDLHRSGLKVHLQDQPFQVRAALLERPSAIATREELCERLRPESTFVEFDLRRSASPACFSRWWGFGHQAALSATDTDIKRNDLILADDDDPRIVVRIHPKRKLDGSLSYYEADLEPLSDYEER